MAPRAVCLAALGILTVSGAVPEKPTDETCENVLEDTSALQVSRSSRAIDLEERQLTTPRGCSAPAETMTLKSRGCFASAGCYKDNKNFPTFKEAWDYCGTQPDCGFISKWTDKKYYVRVGNEPEDHTYGAAGQVYSCYGQAPTPAPTPHPHPAPPAHTCPVPAENFNLPNRGCPVTENDVTTCWLGNVAYAHFSDAWAECGKHPECRFISKWTDLKYYLRRGSDPEHVVPGAAAMAYSCTGYCVDTPLNCVFPAHNDGLADGISVTCAGTARWNGCYERVDKPPNRRGMTSEFEYRHQEHSGSIYAFKGTWRIAEWGNYTAYQAPGITSDTVPAQGWVAGLDARTPAGMGDEPAPSVHELFGQRRGQRMSR